VDPIDQYPRRLGLIADARGNIFMPGSGRFLLERLFEENGS
jgi:hypothetical protein